MRSGHLLVPALVLLILDYTRAQGNTDSLHAVAQSNVNFSQSVYQVLARKPGNVFFSPISMDTILALTYSGARGGTARQLAAGLHLPADNTVVKNGFHALITSFKSDGSVTLDIANKLFVERTFSLKEEFAKIARESFLADAESVNFRTQAEVTRVLINKWVQGKTKDKIKDLLAPGIVNERTKLVLANAVYFKGNWANKFDPKNTRKEQFHVTSTQTKEVDMMFIKSNFRSAYHKELKCRVLELPYVGNKFSMVILLPTEVEGLAALEAKLPSADLSQLLTDLRRPTYVHVSLPKFKMEQPIDLKPVLKELGMVDLFDRAANLTGIADGSLYVTDVVHKAFIEVNEEGSEAAAATGVITSARSGPPNFKVNHPFIFAIVDSTTKSPLFLGRFRQPE